MRRIAYSFVLLAVFVTVTTVGLAQPPVAPPPQPVPTTHGELIVGKWKLTKHSRLGTMLEDEALVCDANGKYFVIHNKQEKITIRGRYILRDGVITWTADVGESQEKIIRLGRHELVVEGLGRYKGQNGTYVRVKD